MPVKHQHGLNPRYENLPAVAADAGSQVERPGGGVLRVHRIRAAPLFERKSFVYRTDTETYVNDFYNEFYAPPGMLVREAVEEWFDRLSVFSAVISPGGGPDPDWLLEGRIEKLYADLRNGNAPGAVLEIEFSLVDTESSRPEIAFQNTYSVTTEASNRSATAIAAAWSESLTQILAEFEADLRALLRQESP
jgi:ABC-type uncharacterized transport system auxiliary subunit